MTEHIVLAVMWLVASLFSHDAARRAQWRGKQALRYAWLALMVVELFLVIRSCNKAWEAFNEQNDTRILNATSTTSYVQY